MNERKLRVIIYLNFRKPLTEFLTRLLRKLRSHEVRGKLAEKQKTKTRNKWSTFNMQKVKGVTTQKSVYGRVVLYMPVIW